MVSLIDGAAYSVAPSLMMLVTWSVPKLVLPTLRLPPAPRLPNVRWTRKFGQEVKLGLLLRRTDLMTGKRKRYSADFKAKVALEALRGELTTAQLASKHGIHQTMVGEWKKQAMEGLAAVFSDRSAAQETAKSSEAEVEKLHAKIGQLLVERDFLAKASGR